MERKFDILEQPKVSPDPKFHCCHCGNKFQRNGPYIVHVRACKRRTELNAERTSVENKPKPKISNKRVSSAVESAIDGPKKRCITAEPTGSCDLEIEAVPVPTIKKVFTCIFCKQPFSVEFEIGKIRRRYACNECATKIRAEEQIRTSVKSKNRFLCEDCGMLYKLEANLMRHMNICKVLVENRTKND
ncbi:gastrula zinc finger protein xFG20-1 [Drosophila obscura]|uniref:gastrula zinc finger protein xFG20-1 n=1 Tax=Drosophila obscura TaxID=7282 RepID=UPI001BB1EA51|nr:gastrula zinc finger protein xFG20-1 [Drosophila obscura]